MVVAASCCGSVFQLQGLGRVEGKLNGEKYRYALNENLVHSAQDLRLGQRFTFQQGNDPKHTAKTTHEQLRDNAVNVLEWPNQIPGLNPIKHLWRVLKPKVPIQPDRA